MSVARTERLLNLLTLLLNARRPVSLRELRDLDEFAAYATDDPKSGERAFERDKAALVELGVPLRWIAPEKDDDAAEGEAGGYLIDRDGYFLPELDLAPADVALLSIAGAAAAAVPHFPNRHEVLRALAKLGFDVDDAAPPPSLTHTPLRAGVDAARVGRNLAVLHDAVAARRRVKVVYESAGGDTQRDVDPWGLYYRQGVWYLVGHCHLRQGERTFHLGRMVDVTLAGNAPGASAALSTRADFAVPASFDLSAHAERRPWEFPSAAPVEVRIRLAERLVPAIAELFGPRARHERRGDEDHVTLTVTHPEALIAAVLPYGAAAEVIAPADLRRRLAETYAGLGRRYEDAAS